MDRESLNKEKMEGNWNDLFIVQYFLFLILAGGHRSNTIAGKSLRETVLHILNITLLYG